MKKILLITMLGMAGFLAFGQTKPAVLIFSKTKGFRHSSIEAGRQAIAGICLKNNLTVDSTEDAGWFNDVTLKKYAVIIFLNTTGDLFNEEQQNALMNYIHSGGGWMGIHAATDAEYQWPWYGQLAGAYFKSHPDQQEAAVQVKDKNHPATRMLPDIWKRFDEWYNFKDLGSDLKILAYLDESSYQGGENRGNHPIIWYHEFEGGKAFYSGFGHTEATFDDPLILEHLLGGIQWIIGIP
jgi:type 1 glutamine amidotransferase